MWKFATTQSSLCASSVVSCLPGLCLMDNVLIVVVSMQEFFNEYIDENAVASEVRTKHMPFLGCEAFDC